MFHPYSVGVVRCSGILCLLLLMGCTNPTPPSTPSPPSVAGVPKTGSTLEQIRQVTAQMLEVDISRITPTTTLEDLGANELDFVELIMGLEDQFNVTISDERLEQMAGTKDWSASITIGGLSALVDELKKK